MPFRVTLATTTNYRPPSTRERKYRLERKYCATPSGCRRDRGSCVHPRYLLRHDLSHYPDLYCQHTSAQYRPHSLVPDPQICRKCEASAIRGWIPGRQGYPRLFFYVSSTPETWRSPTRRWGRISSQSELSSPSTLHTQDCGTWKCTSIFFFEIQNVIFSV